MTGPLPLADFPEVESHPQTGAYGRAYYQAVHGDSHRPLSFAVSSLGKPMALVLCAELDGVIGLHGLPMRIFRKEGIDDHSFKYAVRRAFERLDELADEYAVKELWLRELASPNLSPVSEACIWRKATPTLALNGMVDLEAGPTAWKKALRKSSQQFINWGRKSFDISFLNADNFSPDTFDRFRNFHAEVAGRVTRPKSSWDEMANAIKRKRGELILASLNGKLAAGSLFIDGTETTMYMNGVYDRALDKPLAHFMIWTALERARARGMKNFQLGDIHLEGTVDDKKYQIGYFKRGFATHIESYTDWRWKPPAYENPGGAID